MGAINHACKYKSTIDRSINEITFDLAEEEVKIINQKHANLLGSNKIVQNIMEKVAPKLNEEISKRFYENITNMNSN